MSDVGAGIKTIEEIFTYSWLLTYSPFLFWLQAEEEQRISRYSTSGRRKSAPPIPMQVNLRKYKSSICFQQRFIYMHIVFFSKTYFHTLMAEFSLEGNCEIAIGCMWSKLWRKRLMGGLKRTTTTGQVYEKDQLKFNFSMNYLEVNVYNDFEMFSFRYQGRYREGVAEEIH